MALTRLGGANAITGVIPVANGGTNLSSGFVNGGDNTPAFNAYVASNTAISNATYTTVSLTEDFDTDNAFASNTFTVPSGEGGIYYFNF